MYSIPHPINILLYFAVRITNNLNNKCIGDLDPMDSYFKCLICLISNAKFHTYFSPTLTDIMCFKWLTRELSYALRYSLPTYMCRFQVQIPFCWRSFELFLGGPNARCEYDMKGMRHCTYDCYDLKRFCVFLKWLIL